MDHLRSAKRMLAVVVALLATLLLAGSAAAAQPTREYAPLPDVIIDESCGFVVEVTFPLNDEYLMTFFDASGNPTRLLVVGGLQAVFTNPATGASIKASISGPTRIDLVRGTSTGSGAWALWPDGTLWIVAGRTDFANGTFVGRERISVCDVLGAP